MKRKLAILTAIVAMAFSLGSCVVSEHDGYHRGYGHHHHWHHHHDEVIIR